MNLPTDERTLPSGSMNLSSVRAVSLCLYIALCALSPGVVVAL